MDTGAQEEGDSGAQGGDVEMPMSGDFAGLREAAAKVKLTPRRNGSRMDDIRQAEAQVKKVTKYWECLKNHAASMGGHALDGCGEFMAAGKEGTAEFLKCATCDCHRNFHRREVEGAPAPFCGCRHVCGVRGRAFEGVTTHTHHSALPTTTTATSNGPCATSTGPIDSDDQEVGTSASAGMRKKRFRTKFSNEQKERMLCFAEKLGWKIQKHQEAAVHVFCADVGVKRHGFKVWMHNNKNSLWRRESTHHHCNTKTCEEPEPTTETPEPKSETPEPKSETPEPKSETSEPKSETSEP